ncbi:hypothetical protein YC2023_018133 [Brassica napus]
MNGKFEDKPFSSSLVVETEKSVREKAFVEEPTEKPITIAKPYFSGTGYRSGMRRAQTELAARKASEPRSTKRTREEQRSKRKDEQNQSLEATIT